MNENHAPNIAFDMMVEIALRAAKAEQRIQSVLDRHQNEDGFCTGCTTIRYGYFGNTYEAKTYYPCETVRLLTSSVHPAGTDPDE